MGTADTEPPAVRRRSRLGRWVVAHPPAAYVVLAYVLSWGYWVPLALGGQTVEAGVGRPSQLPGLLGPLVAAVVVTALVDGRAGLADLGRRMTRWRVGWWWLSVVAVLAVGAVGLAVVGAVDDPGDLTRYSGIDAAAGPVVTVVLALVVNGLGEETGWRGFLADRLLRRHGLTTTALLVAAAWAPWHAPLFVVMASFSGFTVPEVLGWVIGLTAGSVVLTWLYRGSAGSILLVAVWHVAFNLTSGTPGTAGTVAAISSTVVMVAAVVVVVADRRRRR
ncbi:CPBP family intramembrane glutamic endopeptidase [Isoptericola sediminis]|uniref:CPBP family intramembrane metalloprotease n=1 Tax=Isoptericola sediminis TaxID=2733572 RepID=A0A849K7R3_9MICO|nr:CPBP family intramembrane glutamic endopeptidase [Isoptericola sediminis]NNU28480.1 CPBP family intramembrane metalloprotease [Isoptericola sediminis]